MEKKIKQRILGIVAIIGVGILVFPLFQTSKELSNQVVVTKAPPFPETAEAEAAVSEEAKAPVNEAKPVVGTTTSAISVDNSIKEESDDVSMQSQANSANQVSVAPVVDGVPVVETATSDQPTLVSSDRPPVTEQNSVTGKTLPNGSSLLVPPSKTASQSAKVKPLVASAVSSVKKQNLASYARGAWVIQLGSFSKKTNAVRLVNHLRANGYKAFIQQSSTARGAMITRVLVGPENKRASARALASKLESDTHLKGIVMSYKPLAIVG